jgi:hypothetical protein
MKKGKLASISDGNAITTSVERSLAPFWSRRNALREMTLTAFCACASEASVWRRRHTAGLLTREDIEFALSKQFNYSYLLHGESKVSDKLVAAYTASGPHVEAMRSLRSQLMLRWFDGEDHRALAIISGEHGDGRSFITANLAVVFRC